MLLGLAESLALWKLDPQWSEAVTFVILFVFIIFRPAGFLGRRRRQVSDNSAMWAYLINLAVLIAINAILAVTLNFVLGYAGIFSMAHAVFFGIGAYTAAAVAIKLGGGFLLATGRRHGGGGADLAGAGAACAARARRIFRRRVARPADARGHDLLASGSRSPAASAASPTFRPPGCSASSIDSPGRSTSVLALACLALVLWIVRRWCAPASAAA